MTKQCIGRGAYSLLALVLVSACAPSPMVPSSRFGVYSTAYLGENNEIFYDDKPQPCRHGSDDVF